MQVLANIFMQIVLEFFLLERGNFTGVNNTCISQYSAGSAYGITVVCARVYSAAGSP